MKQSTRGDWHYRVDQAIITLLNSLDDPPGFQELAAQLATSPYHFHKQFSLLCGESFQACVNRLRLEQTAALIHHSRRSITQIALDCGFSNGEMLSKAVRRAWGLSPRQLRGQKRWNWYLPSPAGIHHDGEARQHWFYISQGGKNMDTKIVHFEEKQFYGLQCRGDYWQLPKLWETLHKSNRGPFTQATEWMSLFPDANPDIPMEEKRALAGFVIPPEHLDNPETQGLTEPGPDAFIHVSMPGGLYAVTPHFGGSELIGPVWDQWMKTWLPESGWQADYTRPNYEWYQNNPKNPELQVTFLVTPVERIQTAAE